MTQVAETSGESEVEADGAYWVDARDGAFPLVWWKVLTLVVLVGGAAIAIMTLIMIPVYERKVIDNVKHELEAAGIDSGPFLFQASYRDLTIRGVIPEGVSADQLRAAAEGAEGVRDLDLDESE